METRCLHARRFSLLSVFLLTVMLTGAVPCQESDSHAGGAALPFSGGERLVYSVKWDPPWYLFFLPSMEAGEAELHLAGEIENKGRKAIRMVLTARSSGSLASMANMNIEDEFVFLAESETFCTLAVSKKVREGKRKRQVDVEYLRGTGRLHIHELDEAVSPPAVKKSEYKENIPDCVQDPFSALYWFRLSPLQLGFTQDLMLANDDQIKEIRCKVEKLEIVNTPVGKFAAWKVNTESLMGGLFKEGGQFKIWFSADNRKLPLQFEVKVKLGHVLGKLKAVTNSASQ